MRDYVRIDKRKSTLETSIGVLFGILMSNLLIIPIAIGLFVVGSESGNFSFLTISWVLIAILTIISPILFIILIRYYNKYYKK